MNRLGTKDTYERENDEAERLVRPAPKERAPRHDKRREDMHDSADDDPDLTKDKDLSLNYKQVGGSLASRLVNRWLVRVAEEGEEEATSSGNSSGPPPKWREWLDEMHEGGKEKVPNPNTEARKAHPEVSFSTALKNKPFQQKAVEEYKKWLSNQKSEGAKSAPAEEEEKKPEEGAKEKVEKSEGGAPPGIDPALADKVRAVLPKLKNKSLRRSLDNLVRPDPNTTKDQQERFPPHKLPDKTPLPELLAETLGVQTVGEARAIQKSLTKVQEWDQSRGEREKTPSKGTAPEDKAPEEKAPEEKTPEEKTPEEKTPEEKTPAPPQEPTAPPQQEAKPTTPEQKSAPAAQEPSKPTSEKPPTSKTKAPKPPVKPKEEGSSEEDVDKGWDEAGEHAELKKYVDARPEAFDAFLESDPTGGKVDGKPAVYDPASDKLVPIDNLPTSLAVKIYERFKAEKKIRGQAKELADLNDDNLRHELFQTFADNKKTPMSEALKALKDNGHKDEKSLRTERVFPELYAKIPDFLKEEVATVADLRRIVKGYPLAFKVQKDEPKKPEKDTRTKEEKDKAKKEEKENKDKAQKALVQDTSRVLKQVQDPALIQVLQDIANPASDISKEISKQMRGKDSDVLSPRDIPALSGLNLPEGAQLSDVIEAAKTIYEVPELKRRDFDKNEVDEKLRNIFAVHAPDKIGRDGYEALNTIAKMHPDDIEEAFNNYMAVRSAPETSIGKDIEKYGKHYETDPNKVRPPSKWENSEGKTVPFNELSDREKAHAMAIHRPLVVALSYGARSRVERQFEKMKVPEETRRSLASMVFQKPKDTNWKLVGQEAKKQFDTSIANPPAKKDRMSDKEANKLLDSLKDEPAARRVAVGYLQGQDYWNTLSTIIDVDEASERSSTQELARSIGKATKAARERSKLYGADAVIDVPSKVRSRILMKLDAEAPEKAKELREALKDQIESDYNEATKQYEELKSKQEALPKDSPYRSAPLPPPPPPIQEDSPEDRIADIDEHLKRVGKRKSFYRDQRSMAKSSIEKAALYHGVEPYPPKHEGFEPYKPWTQVHQRDLGESDYQGILASARKWLSTPFLSRDKEGLPKDASYRAALDLALKTHGGGRYDSSLQPDVYAKLLGRLGGSKEAADFSSTSPYRQPRFEEIMNMKAAAEIRSYAAKIASTHPDIAYDLIDLSTKFAAEQEEKEEKKDDKKDDAKEGKPAFPGAAPPFGAKKEAQEQQDQGQDQGQQKQAAAYQTIKSVVIRTAASNPTARQALLPVLQVLKQVG